MLLIVAGIAHNSEMDDGLKDGIVIMIVTSFAVTPEPDKFINTMS